MRKKIRPFPNPLGGHPVHEFGVTNHRVVNGTVESQLAFYAEGGGLISSRSGELTAEQFKKFKQSTGEPEAFFFQSHLENCGFTLLTETKPAAV